MLNNKALIGIVAIISVVVGIFVGRSVAYSRAEEKKEYAVALKNYDLYLYKDIGDSQSSKGIEKVGIKKDEKFLIIKKENLKVSRKGKMKCDYQVVGTDNKKYQLKKDDIYEILGWSDYRSGNGLHNYYLKLAQNGETVISCVLNWMRFTPLRDGNWWYVKTKDGKTGWTREYDEYSKLLSDNIEFIVKSDAKALRADESNYNIVTEDKEEFVFRADKQGFAKLISKKDAKELLVFRNFDNINAPVDFSVYEIHTKNPDICLWEVTASAGAHAKNCGYWIIGKNKGKWVIYVSDKELTEQGYTTKEWHRLSSKIKNGRLIITSSHEYMPPGAQFGYQLESINDMVLQAYWDYESNMLKLRPWGEID